MTISADIQQLSPSAIIELFQVDASNQGLAAPLYFHAGTNAIAQPIVFQGITYTPFPVEVSGFEYNGRGTLPRPTMRVSNVFSGITVLLLQYGDLVGARVTRIRTLARYLDGQPAADPTAEFPREVYYVDRKVSENRDIVEFELASALDLAGVQLPRRQIIQNTCPWVYRSAECGYTYRAPGAPAASVNIATNEVVIAGHGMVTGDLVRIATTPGGTPMTINGEQLAQDGITSLVQRNLRYAIRINNSAFLLASSQFRAFQGLSDDIQSAGSGVHTFQTGFYFANDTQCPSPSDDACGKRLSSCRIRFGQFAELPYGGFPSAGLIRA